jgi:hypothetical protein
VLFWNIIRQEDRVTWTDGYAGAAIGTPVRIDEERFRRLISRVVLGRTDAGLGTRFKAQIVFRAELWNDNVRHILLAPFEKICAEMPGPEIQYQSFRLSDSILFFLIAKSNTGLNSGD